MNTAIQIQIGQLNVFDKIYETIKASTFCSPILF